MSPHSCDQALIDLTGELNARNWDKAVEIINQVIAQHMAGESTCDESTANLMLKALRKKRRFRWMERFAEAMLLTGVRTPQICRHYAQSLIEQRTFAAAEFVLQAVLGDPATPPNELDESIGLLGRLYKQLYVNPGDASLTGHRPFARLAIEQYLRGYKNSPDRNYFHGINVVALLRRAAADGIDLHTEEFPNPNELAARLLSTLQQAAAGYSGDPPAYETATRVEALVALNRFDDALKVAVQYVTSADADAFEIGSTERQLREIWRLDKVESGGGQILSLLRGELLKKENGSLLLKEDEARRDIDKTQQAVDDKQLEAVLGIERFKTLQWYKSGLACCESVARIETRSQQGFGTGWLVDGGKFSDRWKGKTLLLTNKHVISPPVNGAPYRPSPERQALLPDQAVVHLQILNKRLAVDEVIWSSPDLTLDATLVSLSKLPAKAKPLEIADAPTSMSQPSRVYIIGHPAGRDLEFSMQDNEVLDCDSGHLHYRAPTEGGSSGSPVFQSGEWTVIALHHAGGPKIPRLDKSGTTYPANEGIPLQAIRAATRS